MGNVLNIKTGKILSKIVSNEGYLVCRIYIGSKPKMYFIHRLVALTFWNDVEKNNKHIDVTDDYCVHHKNGDKKDNKLDNLHIVLNDYNIAYDSKAVLKISKTGKILALYRNSRVAASDTRLKTSSIHTVCLNGKQYGGYNWQYADIFDIQKILTLLGKIEINILEWIEI